MASDMQRIFSRIKNNKMNRPNIKKYLKDNVFENGFYESDLYQYLLSADRYIDHLLPTTGSEKSSDISRISGRYYVFTVHNGKLIQDSIALPEMKDAEHYVETMKQGARGKNQEFVILSNAH